MEPAPKVTMGRGFDGAGQVHRGRYLGLRAAAHHALFAGLDVHAGGAAGRAGMWGATGWTRMFNDSWGGQASWLIPAALLFAVVGALYLGRRRTT